MQRKAKVIVIENKKTVHFSALWNYEVHIILTSDVDLSTDRIHHVIESTELVFSAHHGGCHVAHAKAMESYVILPMDAPCSAVAHEAWHAIRYMMVSAGADLDSETVAYHLGYLVGQIIKFLVKNDKHQNDLRKKRREKNRAKRNSEKIQRGNNVPHIVQPSNRSHV